MEEEEEIERSKVGIMKALLQRDHHQDDNPKVIDDLMIRRFLRARNQDIEKATNLLIKYLKWRKEFVPDGSISVSDISNQLADNKLFMQGLDKMGRPVVVCYGGRHKPTNLDEFKRFVTYSLDQICSRMPSGQEKFVCIGDLEGWGYSSSDIRGYLAALSILQDCYPERLGKLIIVHVPYIFMTVWKAIYPFIDSKTKKKPKCSGIKKAQLLGTSMFEAIEYILSSVADFFTCIYGTQIIFVDDKKLKSTLLNEIDECQLPDVYGGKLKLVPIQDC